MLKINVDLEKGWGWWSPHVQPGAVVARANIVPFAISTSRLVFYPSWSFKLPPSHPIRLHICNSEKNRLPVQPLRFTLALVLTLSTTFHAFQKKQMADCRLHCDSNQYIRPWNIAISTPATPVK